MQYLALKPRIGNEKMSEYKHGEMDITTQTETYNGFISIVIKWAIGLTLLAIFLAIFRT